MDLTKGGIISLEVRRIHLALLACFFLSGATGLVYEVVWTRMAGLVFGNTVYAVTTILAAFFSGLALGSYLLGPVADRARRHVHLYGLMEIGIGLYGLCTPFLFWIVEKVYLTTYQLGRENLLLFSLFQFLLVFAILVAPTTLMGGTLPVLSRYFVRGEGEIGYGVGAIYALNTAGAVVGTIGAGFFLLPIMGVGDTIWMAATMNVGIGLLSLVFARRLPEFVAGGTAQAPGLFLKVGGEQGVRVGGVNLRLTTLVALMFAVSGGASMIYEIAWTRALALVLGSSVYAFTTMLATFLIGLAGGSYAFSVFFRRREELGPRSFGWLEIAIGISSLVILPFFDELPSLFLRMAGLVNFSFSGLQVVQFVMSFSVMIIPTLLIGATFPCVVKICTRDIQRLGGNIGTLYAINTFGSILGSFLGGFFFIPWMGAQKALALAASLNLAIGAIVLSLSWVEGKAWRARIAAVAACMVIILAFLIPRWDPHLMASGVAIYGQRYLAAAKGLSINELARRGDLLFFKEGLNATISVHQVGKGRFLRTNGKTDASNDLDMHTQLMSGHIPLFLHPKPERVLIIGMGSGITAGAVARHPVQRIEAVEIEPAVVEAAAFFGIENRTVLWDPRLQVIIGDGRNFLLSAPALYDVIISEPSNPWINGVANLFTLEFYQAAKARLSPEGIMCQWIQIYGILPHDLRMVVKTFQKVFPHTTIWQASQGDFLLVGTPRPLMVDLHRWGQVAARPEIQDDLRSVGLESAEAVLADFVLGEEDVARFAHSGEINTDALPLLEFSAPLSLYLQTVDRNLDLVRSYRSREFPPVAGGGSDMFRSAAFRYQLGKAHLAKGDRREALRQFNAALTYNPRHLPSLLARAQFHLERGLPLKALEDTKQVLALKPHDADALTMMARIYHRQGLPLKAEEYLRQAVAAKDRPPQAYQLLGEILRARRAFDEAVKVYQGALQRHPADAALWEGYGEALYEKKMTYNAIEAFRKALVLDGNNARLYLSLGLAFDRLGEQEEAFLQYGEAIKHNPMLSTAYVKRAQHYMRRQERTRAIRELERAAKANPADVSVLHYLDKVVAE